ncbi:MAG: hypothetical protein PHG08_04485 [Bacilli bacterium]|jgi:hypothetical protein|nr:hypothetical protein [Bacilli bacterium]HHU24943.1 hypothetical protein [Acholeplasmataceae bacterium]
MIHLMDGCIAIFVLFNILFSIRTSFWEYLQVVLSYAIPFILLSIFLGPVYQWGLNQNLVPSFITKLSQSNYHLVYYFGLKLALFLIFVILCKVLFSLTIGKILKKQRKPKKFSFSFLINIPIAIVFSLSFSAWLVFLLARLGVPYQGTVTFQTVKYGENYFDAIGFYEKKHAMEVVESLTALEDGIKNPQLQSLEDDFLALTKPLTDGFKSINGKLSDNGKALLSGNDWLDLYNLLLGNLQDELLLEETNNEQLSEIKGILKDLEDYEKIVQAYKTLFDVDGEVTPYQFYTYLQDEGITTNIRRIDKSIVKSIAKMEDLKSLRIFTVNYLSLNDGFTDTQYLESIDQLLKDVKKYQNFLLTLSQEFPSGLLEINAKHLDELSLFEVDDSSNLSLKEQYLYQNIYRDLQQKFTNSTFGNSYVIALMDDFSENDVYLSAFLEFIKLDNPEFTKTDLIEYIDTWKITTRAKEKLVFKINLG